MQAAALPRRRSESDLASRPPEKYSDARYLGILREPIQRGRRKMPANDAILAESAVELRRRIGSKEISPVELLEICIERIAHINPAVNAITATCYERARK